MKKICLIFVAVQNLNQSLATINDVESSVAVLSLSTVIAPAQYYHQVDNKHDFFGLFLVGWPRPAPPIVVLYNGVC